MPAGVAVNRARKRVVEVEYVEWHPGVQVVGLVERAGHGVIDAQNGPQAVFDGDVIVFPPGEKPVIWKPGLFEQVFVPVGPPTPSGAGER